MATAAPTKARKTAKAADTTITTGNLVGSIAQVSGAVVDVAFEGELPPILAAL